MNICTLIRELVNYGINNRLVEPEDTVYSVNRLLELFEINEYTPDISPDTQAADDKAGTRPLHLILNDMLEYAVSHELTENTITNRDLFDTKIMGLLTPPPSVIRNRFREAYARSSKEATDFYYDFSRATNYIRTERIKKDEKWVYSSEFGDLDITINLSKPEKDPRDIAKAGAAKKSGYPACLLCRENEGYAGHISHPARQNHRIIPIELKGERYYLQYSPYVYYNEHCIVFNEEHVPMKIDTDAFEKLIDFIKLFPHYNIGSNADLPIVGGSILSHDHFQGGNYEFPMQRAPYEREFSLPGFPDVRAGRIKWPMSTIRLSSKDSGSLIKAAEHILNSWRKYTDAEAFVFAYTDTNGNPCNPAGNTQTDKTSDGCLTDSGSAPGCDDIIPHNTITPVARMRDGSFEMDLVLRNNITTDEFPMGVYHPHKEYHHIKKENIGLIEVMGLAILPSRLKKEMAALKDGILNGRDLAADPLTASHAQWASEWMSKYSNINEENIDKMIKDEIGLVFSLVLTDAGVFKRNAEGTAAFDRFINSLGV